MKTLFLFSFSILFYSISPLRKNFQKEFEIDLDHILDDCDLDCLGVNSKVPEHINTREDGLLQ